MQTRSDGNVLVSWGTTPYFTENANSGEVIVDAKLPRRHLPRLPGAVDAAPTTVPAVALEHNGTTLSAAVSWSGATAVKSWRPFVGTTPTALRAEPVVAKAGFETTIKLAVTSCYVEMQVNDTKGNVLATSAVLTIP